MSRMNDAPHADWHALDADETLRRLESTADGLPGDQAARRLSRDGPNVLPEGRRRNLLAIFLQQFRDFMILLLLAAALISGFIGEPQDTIAIVAILLLNAVIGTVQESRAERAIAALREMAAPEARAVRGGQLVVVPAAELVAGDVVILEAGDIVPADLRLLESAELAADESALTGESRATGKRIDALPDRDVPVGDRSNLVFKNTMVTRGRGRGVVVATGLGTEIGRIAGLLGTAEDVLTPLQHRLRRFGRHLALAVLVVCAIVFVAGLRQGEAPMLMFLTAVSLAVAAIPEALPAVVTVSLALGARRLVRENALVRNLPAVETLGSVTYICADKTGTLTENRMTADLFVAGGERREALPGCDGGAEWRELGVAMALNNDVDVAGMTMTLASLSKVVDSLPIQVDDGSTDEEIGSVDDDLSGVDRAWASVKDAMSGLVKVTGPDEAGSPLLTPDSVTLLRANLSLQLQAARLALLKGERAIFQQSLLDAEDWMMTYFDIRSVQVASALETITELRNSPATQDLPDISESLRLLRQQRILDENRQ